jgi:hypothetical protein
MDLEGSHMGLDVFDLVHRIEKRFGIRISNSDFEALAQNGDVIVGDIYDLLLAKMQLRDVGRYDFALNLQFWREMQQVLYAATYVPKDEIELGTPLAHIFPREMRRERWNSLREECPYRVADLDYPGFVRALGFTLAFGVFATEQFHLWQLPIARVLLVGLGVFGLWMVGETYLKILSVCAPLRSRFPNGMQTVKDLCRSVLAVNYTKICAGAKTAVVVDERALSVWDQLVEVVSDVLGVEREQVTFRSRLVHDLGMA